MKFLQSSCISNCAHFNSNCAARARSEWEGTRRSNRHSLFIPLCVYVCVSECVSMWEHVCVSLFVYAKNEVSVWAAKSR